MGQSSSTQGQKSESNSSHLSGSSGLIKNQVAEPVSPSHSVALEPDSHYPDASNNYTGYSSFKPELDEKSNPASYESKQNKKIHETTFKLTANDKVPSFDNLSLQARSTEMSSTPNKPIPTKRKTKTKTVTTLPTSGAFPMSHTNPAFVDSDMDSDSTPNLEESMFDYNDSLSMVSSRSVTPPLPPLSPTNSQRSSSEISLSEFPRFPRSLSATGLSIPKTPDLLTSTTRPHSGEKRGGTKRETTSQINVKTGLKKSSKHNSRSRTTGRKFSPRTDSLHPGWYDEIGWFFCKMYVCHMSS